MNSKSKRLVAVAVALSAGIFTSNLVRAEQDFSQYSNEQLVQMRAQANNMNEADRARFQHELRLRAQNMNANERERLGLHNDSQEEQLRQRLNEDNTQGQGVLTRERQRIENDNGYGRGFGSRQGMSGGSHGRGR